MKPLRSVAATLWTTLFLFTFNLQAQAVDTLPPDDDQIPLTQITARSNAVEFRQVSFAFDTGRLINSDWGEFRAQAERLRHRDRAYLNVFLHGDSISSNPAWVVNNLFVPADPAAGASKRLKFDRHNDSAAAETDSVRHSAHKHKRRKQAPVTTSFDLRPNDDSSGPVRRVLATVLLSPQPLPTVIDIADLASSFTPVWFRVAAQVTNAQGAGPVETDPPSTPPPLPAPGDLVGQPPPPVEPSTFVPSDLAFPIEVRQSDSPNLDSGFNQCIPIGHANTLQYLHERYHNLPLVWRMPQEHIRGFGQTNAAGDVLFWTAEPENSLVAQVDKFSRRLGVFDLDTGGPTSFCGMIQGLFGYLGEFGEFAKAAFRHQGSDPLLGSGGSCGTTPFPLGGLSSTREGENPTWDWIFGELQKGRGVTILFGRYNSAGARTSGHHVRIFAAAKYNGRNYLYSLDDDDQGDNFSNFFGGGRTEQWEVADTGSPGDNPGAPDGRLNMNGTSWEIEFAISYEAIPTPVIP
ncbi:hypothetical protein [Marinobacterium jannaschii]|uniref:hypothetical protein n=1 Tax=Marinobacterium jannaschii TaxID=64970 RepID=UPI00048920BE|nr:hypothetical protein [Marinobacterium jannaschii]